MPYPDDFSSSRFDRHMQDRREPRDLYPSEEADIATLRVAITLCDALNVVLLYLPKLHFRPDHTVRDVTLAIQDQIELLDDSIFHLEEAPQRELDSEEGGE